VSRGEACADENRRMSSAAVGACCTPPACVYALGFLDCAAMSTFVHYRREYEDALARLEAEYQSLTLAEKSRRVLGRDNPLLYSSRAVAEKMAGPGLSRQAVERGLDRQTPQFESIAYHTLVRIPLRRIPLPDARWIFLDFAGQAGGWRYKRADAVRTFCTAIAGKPPEATCRFLSGGIATSNLLDRLLLEEFSRPGSAFRTTAKQIHCRFQLWVAQTRGDIPAGACIQIV
jgi:hypothetical protein